MGERDSSYIIAFDGTGGNIDDFLASLKTKIKSTTAEIEQTTKRVTLFGDLESKVQQSAAALDQATTKVKQLGAQLDALKASGEKATPELVKGSKEAAKEVAACTVEYNKNVDALTKMQNALSRAGVDTSNLAAAQVKLATAAKQAATAEAERAAKQLLGLKTLADIKPEIDRINLAYKTLAESGTLSAKELSQAQAAVKREIAETRAQVTGLATAGKQTAVDLKASFSALQGTFLAITAAVTTVALAISKVVTAINDYRQGVAEIGVVSNLSQSQLNELGDGVRRLARDIGFDLVEGLHELRELLRSGIAPDESLKALEISAQAAKAGLTDLNTTTKVTTILVDGFGAAVDELPRLFDALIVGAHDGGATLKQFAENAGPLLNVARDAKVPFDQLVATLTVMTNASNDAAGSAGALTKILIKLGDPDVRSKLRDLGITTTNIVDVFKQLGERGLGVNAIIDLGIASTKTAAGVTSLTNNAKLLPGELEKIEKASGATQRALEIAADTPRQRWERLQAAIHDTLLSLGDAAIDSNSHVIDGWRIALNKLNDALTGASKKQAESAENSREMARFVRQAADESSAAADKIKTLEAASAGAAKTISDFGPKLIATAKAMTEATNANIAESARRTQLEIDGLDKSTRAQAVYGQRVGELREAEATKRFNLIQQNEANVTAAVERALSARDARTVEAEKKLQTYASETAKIRIDALKPVLDQYVAHYNSLIQQAQAYASKIHSIDQEQLLFNEEVDKKRLAAQQTSLQSFSALDAYAAKLKAVDLAISKGRDASLIGDIENAKRYFKEAESISDSLTTVINRDGQEVIGKFELQGTKLRYAQQIADEYNKSLNAARDAEKKKLDATNDALDKAVPKIQELQDRYDELSSKVEGGLNFRAIVDEGDLRKAEEQLTNLARERKALIKPEVGTGGEGDTTPPAEGHHRGGFVRGFATGGTVFRNPTWSKVPGTGNADTVPVALPAGSFVMRKSATQAYGDGMLASLAQMFAFGGPVRRLTREDFKKAHQLRVQAEQDFSAILDRATGLPHTAGRGASIGAFGQDVRDYVARALEIVRSSQNPDDIQALIDRIEGYYNSFYPAIEDAKKHNVPLVMGAFSGTPESSRDDSQLFKQASQKLVSKRAFAQGGSVDSVPAWVTPGEFIFRPEAVRAISRMFGGGMLPAMNALRVSPDLLTMRGPSMTPQMFAQGGYVAGSGVASALPGASGATFAGDIHLHFGDVADIDTFVRRKLAPAFDDLSRRSAR